MPNRIATTMALAALVSSLCAVPARAQSDDPPARVGRVALTQGTVRIASDVGAELMPAQVNWPVTSGNTISTAPGARTELRIGSTSIRLDGDSALEVVQLDDATLALRLQYGSASVRVLNAETLSGFELETPQARVHLQQPGRVRVDAERVRDTTAVTVFDGEALVEGGGSELTLRAGKRAEFGDDDVRTLAASRDGFDDWALTRDRYDDNPANATAVRYVTSEMTGYEDLDRYGSWSQDPDYGALWLPTVGAGWVPYRDGSWTWLDPWGWTWVDAAPWGYAPFHYGRWVQWHNRWAWAPGGRHEHPVWAPALVGWVGGGGWNVTFRDHNRPLPATGWYPLSPHERFVPHYRAPDAQLHVLNDHVRDDPRRPHDFRPQGLTVVPQDRFNQPGRVSVPRQPLANLATSVAQHAAAGAPPAAPAWANRPRRSEQVERGQVGVAGPARASLRTDGRGGVGEARIDGGRLETGRPDADRGDAGRGDAGRGDGRLDAGRPAGGRADGGRFDAGRPDAGRGVDAQGDGRVNAAPRSGGQWHGPIRQPVEPALAPGQGPAQGLPVTSPTPHQPPQALSTVSPTPHLPPQPLSTVTSPTPHQPQGALSTVSPSPQLPQAQAPDIRDALRAQRREQQDDFRRSREPAAMPQPQAQAQMQQAARPERIEARERPQLRQERPREVAAPRPAPAAPREEHHAAAPPSDGGKRDKER